MYSTFTRPSTQFVQRVLLLSTTIAYSHIHMPAARIAPKTRSVAESAEASAEARRETRLSQLEANKSDARAAKAAEVAKAARERKFDGYESLAAARAAKRRGAPPPPPPPEPAVPDMPDFALEPPKPLLLVEGQPLLLLQPNRGLNLSKMPSIKDEKEPGELVEVTNTSRHVVSIFRDGDAMEGGSSAAAAATPTVGSAAQVVAERTGSAPAVAAPAVASAVTAPSSAAPPSTAPPMAPSPSAEAPEDTTAAVPPAQPIHELRFDACSQVALPWRKATPKQGTSLHLLHDLRVLRWLDERVRSHQDTATAANETLQGKATADAIRGLCEDVKRSTDTSIIIPGGEEGARMQLKMLKLATSRACLDGFAARVRDCRAATARMLARETGRFRSDAACALIASEMASVRRYGAGSPLIVRQPAYNDDEGVLVPAKWIEAEVKAAKGTDGTHKLSLGGRLVEVRLHPWNHAPRQLPLGAFEALRTWWVAFNRDAHTKLRDPICPLRAQHDYFDLTVRVRSSRDARSASVIDARGLTYWLHAMHARLREGAAAVPSPSIALLTAPPAAGKTCVARQVVLHTLDYQNEIIPILIKVRTARVPPPFALLPAPL